MKKTIIITIIIILLINVAYAVELQNMDFNNDDIVDINDLKLQFSDFGKTSNFNSKYDINKNNKIGLSDSSFSTKNE